MRQSPGFISTGVPWDPRVSGHWLREGGRHRCRARAVWVYATAIRVGAAACRKTGAAQDDVRTTRAGLARVCLFAVKPCEQTRRSKERRKPETTLGRECRCGISVLLRQLKKESEGSCQQQTQFALELCQNSSVTWDYGSHLLKDERF